MTIGHRPEFKPDSNPTPTAYETEKAWRSVKASVHTPRLTKRVGKLARSFVTPSCGQYNPHKPFGDSHQKMTLGGRPKERKVRQKIQFYNPSDTLTRSRTPVANFKDSPQRRFEFMDSPAKNNPSALHYETLKPFGSDKKSKMTFGGKHKWKPLADTPGPGVYNTDSSAILPRTPSAMIKQEQMVYYEDPGIAAK